jgi:hypothetical protein
VDVPADKPIDRSRRPFSRPGRLCRTARGAACHMVDIRKGQKANIFEELSNCHFLLPK